MNKELEKHKKAIESFKNYIKTIENRQEYLYDNEDFYKEEIEQNELFLKMLHGVLNYIDNSIPMEVVENKLNEQRSKVTNKCMYCNHNCDKYDVCTALQELLEV